MVIPGRRLRRLPRHRAARCLAVLRRGVAIGRLRLQIEQPLRVIPRATQQLTARDVAEGRRDPPHDSHLPSTDRQGIAEPRQCAAIGAHHERGFGHVTFGLPKGKGREVRGVEAAFAHHLIDGGAKLIPDLAQFQQHLIGFDREMLDEAFGSGDCVSPAGH
jgi:hypothetical protein